MSGKPTLAMYWSASCGGCEIAVLNIHEHILAVDQVFDIAFFPCIADFKRKDVENYPVGHITLCLWNGAIRNSCCGKNRSLWWLSAPAPTRAASRRSQT